MERISSGSPWEQKVGYSRAVIKRGIVFVSATAASGPDGQIIGKGDAYLQARTILYSVEKVLIEAGSKLEDVVQSRIYLTDIALFEDVARAHGEVFSEIRPALSLLHVKPFVSQDILVEIEITAMKDA
ncbi:RidA family protein [Thioclava sp. GXIMD4216]|uniref:RidA family protein n=1 Tax=unclassified Thioclava TaxID=2621713 RepID=UPI0030D3E82D